MLNAAMRLNIPTVFVSGGPMEAGKAVVVDGVAQAPTDLITAISASASPQVDDAGLTEVERSACPTCGSCSGMFTANSMNCLTEALGPRAARQRLDAGHARRAPRAVRSRPAAR